MEYVLFVIIYLLGAFLTVRILAKYFGLFGPKHDPNSLSHDAITTVIEKLGNPEHDGVCYGFSLNWAVAVAEGKEQYFYRQIHLLRVHQSNLPETLERIQQKKEENYSLTQDEQIIETLPDLCKRICRAQDPLEYKETYGKLVWQPDISTILKSISSSPSSPRHIFYKTHTFASRQQAIDYFNLLRNIGVSGNVGVIISTADHAMGFKRTGNFWRFININDLYQQQKHKPYFKFTSAQLVTELYRVCTTGALTRRLTVSTDFIALKLEQQLSMSLENIFPFFPYGPRSSYREKLYYFGMAAWQGDLTTVKKCINSGLFRFSRRSMKDKTPLFIALYQGRREVVQAMISSVPHRINLKRKHDLSTFLHMACRYAGSGIVEDLLQIKGIIIDPQDKNGRTPLMRACELSTLTNERKLFQLLLSKGASLTIKDNQGLTAYDHAVNNKHAVAIEMIEAKLKANQKSIQNQGYNSNQVTYSKERFFKRASKEAFEVGDQKVEGFSYI